MRTLTITYGTSRGAETYGYALVTLRENGVKKARCSGGGYDMRGTVFADWLQAEYQDELKNRLRHKTHYVYSKADPMKAREGRDNFYGSTLNTDTGEITLDGGCGFSSMESIAKAIGLNVKLVSTGKRSDVVIITDTREPA